MIKVGITGISGYSGGVALERLLKHPQVRVTYASAGNTTGRVDEIWPQLTGLTDLVCDKFDLVQAKESCDIMFLAVPHTASLQLTPQLLEAGLRVIDLSGDYRLKNPLDYEKWYGAPHTDAQNLQSAVYGLPEFYREEIKKAKFISNPGCYPTAALLGLAPIGSTQKDHIQSIIIDAKSGVSGAGRKASTNLLFGEVNENFKAYKVLKHQHAPEIDLYLSKFCTKNFNVNFVAHLLPINRGILETIYVQLDKKMDTQELHKIYTRFYKTEAFVRVLPLGQQPEIKYVAQTNYCDIGLTVSDNKQLIVITSAIDNLMKGAAGQAIQNMNIMCNFKETEGLL